ARIFGEATHGERGADSTARLTRDAGPEAVRRLMDRARPRARVLAVPAGELGHGPDRGDDRRRARLLRDGRDGRPLPALAWRAASEAASAHRPGLGARGDDAPDGGLHA